MANKAMSLDLDKDSIRLITIVHDAQTTLSCKLSHAPIHEARYTAVSYEWGSSVESMEIEIDSRKFLVTENLFYFLLEARKRKTTQKLWIDSMCIEQSNLVEKNHHVKRMAEIYSCAEEVWVWLGKAPVAHSVVEPSRSGRLPVANEQIAVSELFNRSTSPFGGRKTEQAEIRRTEMKQVPISGCKNEWIVALQTICARDYWNRRWIIQEFLKAKDLRIWISDQDIKGDDFLAFMAWASRNAYKLPDRPALRKIKTSNCGKLCDERQLNFSTRSRKGVSYTLDQVLKRYSGFKCSNWHDEVYAILSLVKDGDRFLVDYSLDKIGLLMNVFSFVENLNLVERVQVVGDLCELLNVYSDDFLKCTRTFPCLEDLRMRRSFLVLQSTFDASKSDSLLTWCHYGKEDTHSSPLYECSCKSCSGFKFSEIKPGDEIFTFKVSLDRHINSFAVFRPDASQDSGRKFICMVIRYQVFGVGSSGTDFSPSDSFAYVKVSMPHIKPPFELQNHIRRDPADENVLRMATNPPIVAFWMNSCLLKEGFPTFGCSNLNVVMFRNT